MKKTQLVHTIGIGLIAMSILPGNVAAQVPTCSAPTTNGLPLDLEIMTPMPGDLELVEEPCCGATVPVIGSASVGLPLFDFYFIIDSSGSAGACTGADIDGDEIIGEMIGGICSDNGDTVLAAEVTAVRDFVDLLDPATARVAIIQFSFPGLTQRIVQSLTSDFDLVDLALDDVFALGASGATDYAGAIELARTEFAANADPLNRRQLVYFMSDGIPTYPEGSLGAEDPLDSQLSIDAADRAADDGLTINSFGVGFIPTITQDPVLPPRCEVDGALVSTLECVALRTGGVFFASSDPADIVVQLSLDLPTNGIDSVVVFNDTTDESVEATIQPDGTWVAALPTWPDGINFLRVVATAFDGTTCEALTHVVPICVDDTGAFTVEAGGVVSAASPMSPMSPLSPLSPATSCAVSSQPTSEGVFGLLRTR